MSFGKPRVEYVHDELTVLKADMEQRVSTLELEVKVLKLLNENLAERLAVVEEKDLSWSL